METTKATQKAYDREMEAKTPSSAEVNEAFDKAKQVVSDAWDRTNRGLSDTYEHAVVYGRENPGKMTLMAFGAGLAVGLLIAGTVPSSRSRNRRIVVPVMNALTEIATELFH